MFLIQIREFNLLFLANDQGFLLFHAGSNDVYGNIYLLLFATQVYRTGFLCRGNILFDT